jgi:hypothetical protein
VDAQELAEVDLGHSQPPDLVIAKRVLHDDPVFISDDPGPQRRHVRDPGSQDEGSGCDGRHVIVSLHGKIDQVGDGEKHPHPPDQDRDLRAELLRLNLIRRSRTALSARY